MKKFAQFFCLFFALMIAHLQAEEGITGFWKTQNEETSKTDSIVVIYEHDGLFYGRLLLTFDDEGKVDGSVENPGSKALGVSGEPPIAGLDILWGLKKGKDGLYEEGHIIDPKKGKVYSADVWREGDHLIVRGEVLHSIFGKNIIWQPVADGDFPSGFIKPNTSTFVPVIPQPKK